MPIVKQLRRLCKRCDTLFEHKTKHSKICPKCLKVRFKKPRNKLLEIRVTEDDLNKFKVKCEELNKSAYELITEFISIKI